jgi:hypothetical protein
MLSKYAGPNAACWNRECQTHVQLYPDIRFRRVFGRNETARCLDCNAARRHRNNEQKPSTTQRGAHWPLLDAPYGDGPQYGEAGGDQYGYGPAYGYAPAGARAATEQ